MRGITFIRDCVLVDEMKKGIKIIFRTILDVTNVVVVFINIVCVSKPTRATYAELRLFLYTYLLRNL